MSSTNVQSWVSEKRERRSRRSWTRRKGSRDLIWGRGRRPNFWCGCREIHSVDQDQDAKILRTGQAMQGQRNQINTRRLAYGKNDESARPEARRLEFQKLPARSQRVVEMKCKSQKEAFNQKKEPHLSAPCHTILIIGELCSSSTRSTSSGLLPSCVLYVLALACWICQIATRFLVGAVDYVVE